MLRRLLSRVVVEQLEYLLRNFYGGSNCGKDIS